jgi:hypothetical protein
VRRRRLLVAVAVAAAALTAWLSWPRQRAATTTLAASEARTPHHAAVGGREPPAPDTPSPPKLTLGGPTEERLERNLDEYKKVAVYPPWSRAFTDGTKYLLTWNKPATQDLPMDDTPGKETSYHFDADRAHVAYGDALTSWIEVWKDGDPQHRLPVTVEDAWVNGTAGPKTGRLFKLSYHDDGQDGDEVAGDGRYSNRFVPSQVAALKQATQVQLSAVVSREGVRRVFVREFTYAPRSVADVLGVSDSVRGGSLVVTLDVDVHDAGTYDFEANLVSGNGASAIGYSQLNYRLSAGRQNVDLVFFGRMFAEVGLDGPYQVRDIRGLLLSLDGGEHNIPFSRPTPYVTKPWRHGEFSPAEWDDDEKRQRIANMERAIGDTAAGRIGGATTQPQHIHIDENGVAHVVNDAPPAN